MENGFPLYTFNQKHYLPHPLLTFRSCFMKYDATHWDEQFIRDVNAGKLNALAAEALEQHEKGQCKRL